MSSFQVHIDAIFETMIARDDIPSKLSTSCLSCRSAFSAVSFLLII